MLYQAPVCQLKIMCVPSHLFMSDSFNPVDCKLPGSSVYGNSPGKNTEVGCHALLKGSLQSRDWTQVSELQVDSLPSESPGKPKNTGVGSLSLLQEIFPRNWTGVSCIADEFFTSWATMETPIIQLLIMIHVKIII